MVDELRFEDNASPWLLWKRDPKAYTEWAEGKKGTERITYRHVTGTGMTVMEGERMPMGKILPVRRKQRAEREEQAHRAQKAKQEVQV